MSHPRRRNFSGEWRSAVLTGDDLIPWFLKCHHSTVSAKIRSHALYDSRIINATVFWWHSSTLSRHIALSYIVYKIKCNSLQAWTCSHYVYDAIPLCSAESVSLVSYIDGGLLSKIAEHTNQVTMQMIALFLIGIVKSKTPYKQLHWNTLYMKNAAFWDVTPCGSCKNRRFGGT
jgi:hypothetical protein